MIHSPEAARAVGPQLAVLEAGLVLFTALIAFGWPRTGRVPESLERWFGRLARKRRLAVATVALTAGLLRLAILPWVPIPEPFVHDEFSYLLAADTFSSGRLTNATHPMWTYMESFHISHVPSYMSMYFPAQGMALAFGKVLFGHPWFGVWLSMAVLCGSICWMLQAWLPPGWALFGGFLAILRLSLFSYWVNMYSGGAVAAIGGCLVIGGARRFARHKQPLDLLLVVGGAVILANSRPYEGVLLCLPTFVALGWVLFRRETPPARQLVRLLAPALTLGVLSIGLMAFYNYRVFGNPLTLPYQVNRSTYAVSPLFAWQQPRPEPAYRYRVMKEFYTREELPYFQRILTVPGFLGATAEKAGILLMFFCGIFLAIPLAMLPWTLRDRRMRPLVWLGAFSACGMATNAWFFPHYAAPLTGALYALLLQSLRHLRVWRPEKKPVGLFLVRAIPVICLLLVMLRLFHQPLHIQIARWPSVLTWAGAEPAGLERARIQASFEALPGRHLAIVKYQPGHVVFDDWVYNAADIDGAKVVWVRQPETRDASELVDYFRSRNIWLVEPDVTPTRISRFTLEPKDAERER